MPGFKNTPYFLKESWYKLLGIQVTVVEDMQFDEIFANLAAGKIHMVLLSWLVAHPDPDDPLRGLFHSNSRMNSFGWQNKEFDQLLDTATRTDNTEQRFSLYHQADKLLVQEETAVAPLYYLQAYSLVRSQFQPAGSQKILRRGLVKFKNVLVK